MENMKKNNSAQFIILAVVIGAIVLSATAGLIMVFANVVLAHYNIKQLDFLSALAIAGLLWIHGLTRNVGK